MNLVSNFQWAHSSLAAAHVARRCAHGALATESWHFSCTRPCERTAPSCLQWRQSICRSTQLWRLKSTECRAQLGPVSHVARNCLMRMRVPPAVAEECRPSSIVRSAAQAYGACSDRGCASCHCCYHRYMCQQGHPCAHITARRACAWHALIRSNTRTARCIGPPFVVVACMANHCQSHLRVCVLDTG
jgi:hypothetical protein